MNEAYHFTGIEPVIDWLEQTGLLDALTDMLTEMSVETATALFTLLISAIGGLAIGGIILTVLIVCIIVAIITTLILYVLRAIGLCKMAKKLGVKYRFLAWIPYANSYVLGACAEQSAKRNGKKTWRWGLILLFTTLGMTIGQPIVQLVLGLLLSFVPGLSALVGLLVECSSLILLGMTGYCLWRTFHEFMDNVLAIIFAVIGPLGGWVCDVLLFIVGFLKLRPADSNTVIQK